MFQIARDIVLRLKHVRASDCPKSCFCLGMFIGGVVQVSKFTSHNAKVWSLLEFRQGAQVGRQPLAGSPLLSRWAHEPSKNSSKYYCQKSRA